MVLFNIISMSRLIRKRSNWQLFSTLKLEYDAIIIGAGHNGLVAAAYLQKNGLNVCVLEKRHVIGGAAVTEELVPGFKFSRCSYLLSLFRPQIIDELELKKHGLKIYLRNPYAYVPLWRQSQKNESPPSLILGLEQEENKRQIAQFSLNDAEKYTQYEKVLGHIVDAIQPILDSPPPDFQAMFSGSFKEKIESYYGFKALYKTLWHIRKDFPVFYNIITSPAAKVLNQWFDSELLKAFLSTDSVIGAMHGPYTPGSGYVLLHHVMGQIDGVNGAWGYVEGGMGSVSAALARVAVNHGAHIFTQKSVSQILLDSNKNAFGVVLKDDTEIKAKIVLSNATAKITFLDLLPQDSLNQNFRKQVEAIDYSSPVTKINVALKCIPNFLSNPNDVNNRPLSHHQASIHLNCRNMEMIQESYEEAKRGSLPKNPMLEITIPSSIDPTLAPKGCHVMSIFSQYTPYNLAGGQQWDQQVKDEYADNVFNIIEDHAPGFKESVIYRDILSPCDLEQIFGLTGGNIFHGAMSLHQLYFMRPVPSYPGSSTPITGLYLCGSGTHPGGGVMGSPGRLAAMKVLSHLSK